MLRRILGRVLVVQERRRFYRESMTVFLRRQLRMTQVLEGVADAAGLLEVAAEAPVDHAVIEADGVPWDVHALAASVREKCRGAQLIGLSASSRPTPVDGVALLPRGTTPDQVATLVEPGADRGTPFLLNVATGTGSGPLTDQQLRVLALLSLGLTASTVAARLGLSERGVAKSKTAIFTKLGAQSQAQAVAAALANGLLGPSTVLPQTSTDVPIERRVT
jgi:DNA-binding NarL/FixJ family response regulator